MSLNMTSMGRCQLNICVVGHAAEQTHGDAFVSQRVINLSFPNALFSQQLAQVHALLPCCNPGKIPGFDCRLGRFIPKLYSYDKKVKVCTAGYRIKAWELSVAVNRTLLQNSACKALPQIKWEPVNCQGVVWHQ